jgi:hypothetical protein
MRISPLTNPSSWYKKRASDDVQEGTEQLSLIGHTVAVGLTAYSAVLSGIHYGRLAVEALMDDSPLSFQEKIRQADMRELAQSRYQRVHASNPAPPLGDDSPMKDLPSANLKRPFLMVPGWDTSHDRFLTFTSKLVEDGHNGGATYYIQDGNFFADRDCREPMSAQQIPPDAKVFVSVFTEIGQSPQATAPQLQANLQAIQSVTGQEAPDILAYSQGGLATRHFLDNSEQKVGKLMMLGTPNLGSGLADVSKLLYNAQDHGYAVDFMMRAEHLEPGDESSIRYMATDSPHLSTLNSRWDQQMTDTQGFKIVGSSETPTLHWGWPVITGGDRMVEVENLAPEGVEKHLIGDGPWTDHRDLPYSAQVYMHAREHFGW